MACTGLKGFSILHHGLNCVGVERSGKTFVCGFYTDYDRHSHIITRKFGVDVDHLDGAIFRFLGCRMCAVAFLPKEFGSTQEHTGAHFPAHHIRPLVAQHGEIAIAVDPVLICAPDNSFRSRAHNQFFLKACIRVYYNTIAVGVVLEAVVCDNRTFFGKPFDMLGFAAEERFWNEKREVGVLYTCFLEHTVKFVLHFFPNCITVGLDNHTASNRRLLCEIGFDHELIVPLRVVFAAFGQILKFFCHF